ncbi:unnamed protein product [Alternaria alternata]
MRSLNARTFNFALRLATIYGWIDGCKTMLQEDFMETLDEDHFQEGDLTVLGSLAYTKRLEMMQLWLLRRADFGLPQLQWIGYAEDVFDFHECESLPEFSKGIAYNMSFYLRNLRHEIDLLVRKHGIDRIEHNDDPDYNKQPYPRYSPKEERRIKDEDAPLHEILEELVPMFSTQFDAVGGRLEDFVVDVMIPKMREVARELKVEDAALYGAGRRELGVVMYEDEEEEDEQSEGGEEEEEQDEDIEESDDEY